MLRECYRQGADAFGWSAAIAGTAIDARRTDADGLGHGDQHLSYQSHPARGHVRVAPTEWAGAVGTQDLGTGTYTVMSQVAADTLGVPMAGPVRAWRQHAAAGAGVGRLITVPSVGAGGARRVRGGAAKSYRPRARRWATGLARADADALRLENGAVAAPETGVDRRVAGARRPGSWKRSAARPGDGSTIRAMLSGRSSPKCGWIPISATSASTAGRRVRWRTGAERQDGAQPVYRGIIYGIGMALLEETHVDAETGRSSTPTSPNTWCR